jgi:Protein of unknown function (DUF4238)
MSDITRETHYVPQATLRRWSEDGVNVWAYRLLAPSANIDPWQLCAIKGLTKQRDLYTTFEGDQEGDDFEKFITREIEEPGQAAIEKVIGNFKMKPGDWHAVAKFVAAQQMRTPMFFVEWVRRINEEMPKTLQSILSELEQKAAAQIPAQAQEPDDHNYLREKLRVTVDPVPGGNGLALVHAQVSSSRTAWLRFMRRMLTDRIELFCHHRWRVLKLAADDEWPLTDNPVLALNYVRRGEYDFGAGWGKHNSNFIMPVSPRVAIFTQVGSRETGPWHASLEQTRELQGFAVERALRWIIARKPDPQIVALRPRAVDAEAYKAEQEAWRAWNDRHLSSEAEFRAPRTPLRGT